MKEINIKIVIDEETGKIATGKQMKGYNQNSISHQFEILGIMQNLVEVQQQKLRTLAQRSK